MKWISAVVVLAGCQRHGGEPPVKPEYAQDIATLCDVVHLSGADKMPDNERWPVIAMWLGPHLKTSEAHDFLVEIQPLTGATKGRALEVEAHRVGLSACALAAEWH